MRSKKITTIKKKNKRKQGKKKKERNKLQKQNIQIRKVTRKQSKQIVVEKTKQCFDR